MKLQFKQAFRPFTRSLRYADTLLRQRCLPGNDIVTIFFHWLFLRGSFNRGYVLISGLYFVVGVHLSASQIVFLGTVMSITLMLMDIPTGIWADALGRKRPMVIGHLLLAVAMMTTGLVTAIVASGIGMTLLALFVATQFTERAFIPGRERRWLSALSVVQTVINLVRHDHEILLICIATILINIASMSELLFPRQLIHLGFPSDTVLWYTAVGICSTAAGFIALRLAQVYIDGVGITRHIYMLACFIGMLGLLVLAIAPNALLGGVGVLLVSGITVNVARTVSVIWVNERTTSSVRATMHSFLDQAEAIGQICGGFILAVIVGIGGMSITLLTSAVLMALTGTMVALAHSDRVSADSR